MSKLTKKDIKAIEDLDWSVKKTDDGYFLENYSPAGGDMVIEEKTKEDIIQHCKTLMQKKNLVCGMVPTMANQVVPVIYGKIV